jgi:hypothetical protein
MTGTGRRVGRPVAVGLVLTLVGSVVLQLVAVPSTRDGVLTSSVRHPYGPPQWLPTRLPANIGCAKEACGPYEGHHYWALDLTGRLGDPLYASGAGILHVGAVSPGCPDQGSPDKRDGTWVWIDHGGGVVSRYHHLDSVSVPDGTAVTPETQIGTMGHSGDNQPCATNYVHFEVRTGGVTGTRVDPGQLLGCTSTGLRSIPAVLGASSWDDPAIHTRPRIQTPALTSDCVTPTWLGSPEAPRTVDLTAAPASIQVGWGRPPADVDTVVITTVGARADGSAGRTGYVTVPATATGYTFGGLDDGRSYDVTVAYRNAVGTSLASEPRTATPVDKPAPPPAPRYATWPAPDFIHYGWFRPADNGRPVRWFTVAWRCATPGADFGDWTTGRQGVVDTYRNIGELERYDRCEVKVRARNDVGASEWSTSSTLGRPG